VYSIQHYVIKFVSDLRHVSGFLRYYALMELEGRSYIPNIVGASLYQGTPPQTALIVVNTTGYHPSKLILLSN
jgi:hypothetical protein